MKKLSHLAVAYLTLAAVLAFPLLAVAQTALAPTSAVSPELFVTLCTLGSVASLGIQHALQSGKWPPNVNLSPMVRGLLAILPGAASAILLTAQAGGVFNQHALAAGIAGMAGALQGLFLAWWPGATEAPAAEKK